MGKRSAAVAVIVTIAAGLIGITATSASATASESSFVSRINQERSSRGLRTLVVKSDLVTVARRHSARMAKSGDIYHNRNLANEVGGPWTELGENVGVGGDVATLHRAFMQSTGHRANILRSAYNQIGVGVAYGADSMMYVTEVFAKRGTVTAVRTTTTRTTTTRTASRTSTAPRTTTTTAAAAAPARPVPLADPQPEPRTVTLLARLVGE